MRFVPLTDVEADREELLTEYKQAKAYAKARVGEHYFFYPTGFCKRGYVPYSEVVWAFRRMGQLTRGSASYTVNKLVLVTRDKRQLEYIIHKDGTTDCLERLKRNYPAVDIGYEESKAEKYNTAED